MVDSPNYEKLKLFLQYAKANEGLSAWKADHEEVEKGFEQAIERLKQYRDSHGFTGKAGKAMDNWVNSSIRRINGYRDQYTRGYEAYEAGRSAMAEAYAEGQSIKDELLDASTAAMRYNPVVFVPASVPSGGFSVGPVRVTTGSAYVDAVEAQANIQREEACARILSTVNDRTSEVSNVMENYDPLSAMDPKGVDEEVSKTDTTGGGGGGGGGWRPGGGGGGGRSGGGHGGGGGYSPENGFGREGGRNGEGYPGGFDKPWWSEADAAAARNRVIASGAVPRQELPYGELGSRTNPITDPQDLMDTDLLHTRVNGTTYRNGIVGGHTPAPPADAQHPLWRLNGGGASEAAAAGRLGGAGVLGAGALGMRGAARMGSGFGGASGSAGGLGAAGAGTSGVTGTTGAGGSGAAGAAGAAGRGGAGAGGGFMGGAGAGAGMGKDDKKGRKRKYVAFTVDDDEDDLPAGYVNPLSQTYGTDRTITPVKREDDGWDLRQW